MRATLLVLGDVLPADGKVRELDIIALSAHERGHVTSAKVALPIAAWAETSGTITNAKGLVQRMHAAFPPPGQALPGWEALARIGQLTNVKLAWTHAREVFKDMTASVGPWSALVWAREGGPWRLRFAGSRG